MTVEEQMFFHSMPGALPLYQLLRDKLLTECPDTTVIVQKSQITFRARHGFAFVSLRRMKGCPKVFFILSFGLSHRLDSNRISVAVEPYPNRWTHHVILSQESQLNEELMDWLREAHDFAWAK